MVITKLQILLDLNKGNEHALLEEHACLTDYGYLFVDSKDGQCYLFDKNGKLDDIKKVKTIDEGFAKKDIKKIAVPDGVKSIGDYAFYNYKSLANIEIPDSIKSIRCRAFDTCTSLTSIEISNGVESIGDWAFEYCESLTSIKIPNSVKIIGKGTFRNCTSLTSIKIPKGVESIRYWAFENCKSLKSIVFKGKTVSQVKEMDEYPWGIEDESIIRCQKS